MKILFLTNIPSPYRVDFFNELGKSCELTVVFEGDFATDRNKNWKTGNIEHFTPIFLNGWRLGTDKFLSFSVLKLLQKKWNVIVVGGYSTPTGMLAIEYMWLHKIPFYLEVDGGFIRPDNKLKFWLKKHFVSAASGWFSSGKETTRYLVHYGANKAKIYEYPFSSLQEKDILPTLPTTEEKKELRKQLGIKEDKVIISVGRFSYQKGYGKGYDILMKASESLPDNIGVYIIGDEPTEEFSQWKKDKNLTHVHFVGFQSKEDLKKWYQAADAFVLPTREDVWGLVINEAMAQGLPIVTTDRCVAGLELVREGENGYVVPVADVQALAWAITQIFSQDYRAIGQKSLEFIKPYTIKNMVNVHKQILFGENNYVN